MKSHRKKLLFVAPVAALLFAAGVFADSTSTNFDGFTNGSVNGQGGWSATSTAYDQAVVDFNGGKALRISDAVTSGTFDDWIYAKPVADAAGEAAATASTFPVGNRQTHFEASFDILSASPDETQGGLHLSVSPDRGDGSRMSWLLFEDTWNGIDVTFSDVPGTNTDPDFRFTQVATDLDPSVPHNVRFVIDFVDGESNDVVKIYIDDVLVHTGLSWENFYRHSPEQAAEQTPRLVKTLLFQSRANYTPANQPAHQGKGFLVDNVNIASSVPASTPPEETTATITLNRVTFGGPNTCQNVMVDSTPYCVTQGDPEEVQVAAGEHTVSMNLPGGNATIVCFSNGGFDGYAPFSSSPSVTLDLDEGDSANCIIYSLSGPQ